MSDRLLADLHVHSRYSRATSRDLTVPTLAGWAQRKGLDLLATGDITHPAWRGEVRDALEEDGAGLLVPTAATAAEASRDVPAEARRDLRFVVNVEVSSIWLTRTRSGLQTAPRTGLLPAPWRFPCPGGSCSPCWRSCPRPRPRSPRRACA